ncbi:MAG: TIGR01777 family oxidoreductase [Gemmatimonadales bacterium]
MPAAVVERSTTLPVSAEAAFAWHERPGAFERLLPPWERVTVIEQSGGLTDGARLVLRVMQGPLPLRWVARHRDTLPGRRFVDEQVEGPFSRWVHFHRFDPDGAATSRMTDRIEYALRLGPASILTEPLIRHRLERMLAYRHALLRDDLEAHGRFGQSGGLRVAVSGASGLLGRALLPFLTTGGHEVLRLVRGHHSPPQPTNEVYWNLQTGRIETDKLEGLDGIVHLAGENIGARWTKDRKRRIRDSRGLGTRFLCEALARLRRKPKVLVTASAVGIYGNRGDELLTEGSATLAPPDFLVEVGREWEAATEPARAAGIRVVMTRFGMMLSPAGGVLAKMLPAFRAGLGGPLGSGSQWMSWISIDDAVGAVHHAIMTEELSGAVNTTAPQPVTNREFTATLGRVLGRPALLPVPAPGLRFALGEMGRVAVLGSARVVPERLIQAGYRFRHPALEGALRFVLGRETR